MYLRAAQLDTLASEAGRLRSLVGVGGLRWREAIALRVCDVDLLRRRVELHRNEVRVRGTDSSRTRTAPWCCFVMMALTATATGECRAHLLWTAPHGGDLRPPGRESWLTGALPGLR